MGIPKFVNVWLKRRDFKGVFQLGLSGTNSSLMLDANGIIHRAAQLTYGYGLGDSEARRDEVRNLTNKQLEDQMFESVGTILNQILSQVRPKDTFVLAIDGVAPMAKIKQQRSRRFMGVKNKYFNSDAITPGTEFMFKLDKYLVKWLDRNKLTLPPTVIYSSHMVPGEGEHKIMDFIRNGQIEGDQSHVLYGLDADLIMLSLMAPLDHILLMREDVKEVVNIDHFRTSVARLMTDTPGGGNVEPWIYHDFVVIMSLLGNDFIPHSPTLEDFSRSIDILVETYREVGQRLIDTTLNLKNLMIFISKLAEKEPEMLIHESTVNYKFPSYMIEQARSSGDFSVERFRAEWYINALTPRSDENEELILELDPDAFEVSSEDISHMVEQYLRGIFWVYQYYSRGLSTVNIEWFYNYYHAPLFTDVAQYKSNDIDGYVFESDQRMMTPIHQLLSVLPPSSKPLVPAAYRILMEMDSPIADLYPVAFIRELEGKYAEWQAIPIIPMVNAHRIFEAVDSVQLTGVQQSRYSNKYKNANNVKIVKSLEYREDIKVFREYKRRLRTGGTRTIESGITTQGTTEDQAVGMDLSVFRGTIINRDDWHQREPLI